MRVQDLLTELAAGAATGALGSVGLGEVRNLGQFESEVKRLLMDSIDQYGPELAAKLAQYLEPVAMKAVEAATPVAQEMLKKQIPIFAAIAGLYAAGAILIGVAVSRETIKRTYRRNYRRAA